MDGRDTRLTPAAVDASSDADTEAGGPVRPEQANEQPPNDVITKLGAHIVALLVFIVFLLPLSLIITLFFYPSVSNIFPWSSVLDYAANQSQFSKVMSTAVAFMTAGAGFITAKKENQRLLVALILFSFGGLLMSIGLMFYSISDTNGVMTVAQGSELYSADAALGYATFKGHMLSVFGGLAVWFFSFLAARLNFRLNDIKALASKGAGL
jgi:hypothetical protein